MCLFRKSRARPIREIYEVDPLNHSGSAEVSSSKVTVLVESAELTDQIDRERAAKAKERAEEKLARPAQGRFGV